MRTKVMTTALLIALGFATATLNGQRAREDSRRENTRPESRRVETNRQPVSTTNNTNPRSDYKNVERTARNAATTQRNTYRQPANNRAAQTQRGNSKAYRQPTNNRATNRQADQRVTTTTGTRNDAYRGKPARQGNAPVRYEKRTPKPNKYTYERSRHTHSSYYLYPEHKVNIHYHRGTHRDHYRVAYYPASVNIYWDRNLYHDYRRWYPEYKWSYHYGERIHSISVFDTPYFIGDVAQVYGRVYATWHNQETDDYLLFFGGDYPSHKFTLVLPGKIARKYSWRPERYFLGEHVLATGLITTWDGNPEIVIRNKKQLRRY